ncbi:MULTISPECIES: processed acidic surface protein [Geobacillus]|nr:MULTISPECIES: processed acidic surface protein [Geobacillus]MED4924859.1 processed acidic surface protein [Anoxybacillus geothermalis]AOL35828.1 peptidase [Geobacillus thermoleovorans]EQB94347.1 peptidase [Geobacillus sp. A8]MBW7642809.1 processed acidic surface protein [Geobacillus thermoleovorans]OPX03814.1 processed acidic surface protein [Geobacillus sp. LEMMY01]
MRQWLGMAVLVAVFASFPAGAAAISRSELEQYAESVGWTVSDLLAYLDQYGLTAADFRTMDEMKQWLGTPITDERLHAVLRRHGLTVEELEALLGQFGETVQDYTFVEDLDRAIRFYSQHNAAMQQINDLLGALGMTEQEVRALTRHIASLDDPQLAGRLAALRERLRPFAEMEGPWTETERRKLRAMWEEGLRLLKLEADEPDIKAAGAEPIRIRLYNRQGEEVADIAITREMLTSGYIVRAGEKGIDAGLLAVEMKGKMYGEKLPETASPYLTYTLAGLMLASAGFLLYRRVRRLKG